MSKVVDMKIENEANKKQEIENWCEFLSWARWNPDLFCDLITPTDPDTGKKTGIYLGADQRILMRSMARFPYGYYVFPRGYGKCISGDSIILTSDGLKEIGSFFDYKNNNKEMFIDGRHISIVNRHGEIENVNAGVYSGFKDTVIISTEEGIEIETSLNHPLLVMGEDGDLAWKKSSDIAIGDYIVTRRGDNIWGKNTTLDFDMDSWVKNLPNGSRQKICKCICNTPTMLTEDMALIIGYLIGDGCITSKNCILFTSKDKDMVDRYKDFMENVIGRPVCKKSGSEIDYVTNGMYVREYFRQIGLKQTDAFGKEIPQCILDAPKNIVSSCIMGMFDTDGSVTGEYVEYCTASEKMSKQLQTILLNFGIICNRRKKYNKKFGTYSFIISITGENRKVFEDEIGFSCTRKKEILREKINIASSKGYNTNKDVIPNQMENVCDISEKLSFKNVGLKSKLGHVRKGNNQLTYSKNKIILDSDIDGVDISHFKTLNDENYFFSKVKYKISSKNHVYDLSVPGTNSFIANGIVNHNTLLELLSVYITAMLTPDITISMTATTMQVSAGLFNDKHNDILKFYPIIADEIVKCSISKDSVEIIFKSGAKIDNLMNGQTAKGKRRIVVRSEESALLKEDVYQDCVESLTSEPYVNIKDFRYDPFVISQQAFFTTSYYKGDAHTRNLNMWKDMANLDRTVVLGASFELACRFGRGRTRNEVLSIKEKVAPSFWRFNYLSEWSGSSDNCIVDVNKLIDLRTLEKAELKTDGKSEYYMSVDIARSDGLKGNQSSVSVIKVKRSGSGKIREIQAPFFANLPNGLNFQTQALLVKRIYYAFKPKALIYDANVIGKGLQDQLTVPFYDPLMKVDYPAFDMLDNISGLDKVTDDENAIKCMYPFSAQADNSTLIVNFIDFIESKKLRLLTPIDQNNFDASGDYMTNVLYSHINTDLLIEEVSNLQLKQSGARVSVEQTTKTIDKDRYSSLGMNLFYVATYEDGTVDEEESFNILDFSFSAPQIR